MEITSNHRATCLAPLRFLRLAYCCNSSLLNWLPVKYKHNFINTMIYVICIFIQDCSSLYNIRLFLCIHIFHHELLQQINVTAGEVVLHLATIFSWQQVWIIAKLYLWNLLISAVLCYWILMYIYVQLLQLYNCYCIANQNCWNTYHPMYYAHYLCYLMLSYGLFCSSTNWYCAYPITTTS